MLGTWQELDICHIILHLSLLRWWSHNYHIVHFSSVHPPKKILKCLFWSLRHFHKLLKKKYQFTGKIKFKSWHKSAVSSTCLKGCLCPLSHSKRLLPWSLRLMFFNKELISIGHGTQGKHYKELFFLAILHVYELPSTGRVLLLIICANKRLIKSNLHLWSMQLSLYKYYFMT